jgi:hypothetical protein
MHTRAERKAKGLGDGTFNYFRFRSLVFVFVRKGVRMASQAEIMQLRFKCSYERSFVMRIFIKRELCVCVCV